MDKHLVIGGEHEGQLVPYLGHTLVLHKPPPVPLLKFTPCLNQDCSPSDTTTTKQSRYYLRELSDGTKYYLHEDISPEEDGLGERYNTWTAWHSFPEDCSTLMRSLNKPSHDITVDTVDIDSAIYLQDYGLIDSKQSDGIVILTPRGRKMMRVICPTTT